MGCPLYKNFTRLCIEKYQTIMKFDDLRFCESDSYNECPVYKIMNCNYNSKYLDTCVDIFLNETPNFLIKLFSNDKVNKLIANLLENYCLSKSNSINCKRYKRFEKGERPSYKIFSDGKLPYFDILFNRL